jgi:outer membrane protein OmpA-like peptidoglycan-associated protein
VTGTTLVDEKTRSNIAVLAQSLADPNHPNQRYTFVGHADIRGDESNNVLLSKRRAEAIYQSVTLLEPSLQGRIEVTGRGSSEPIDLGNDERAYRANRRLQVLLR